MSSKSKGNPFRREKQPLNYVKLDLMSMTISLSRNVWIIENKNMERFYYSVRAVSFVACLDLATMFSSQSEAWQAVEKLEVSLSSQCRVVNLYKHISRIVGQDPVQTGEAASDWDDMGLVPPENV